MLEGVPGLMAHDPHALGARRSLDVQELIVFKPAESRVGEVERDREPGDVRRREPVVREPDVRFEPQEPLFQLGVEPVDALLQPGALDRETEVLDPHSQEAVVGEALPAQSVEVERVKAGGPKKSIRSPADARPGEA